MRKEKFVADLLCVLLKVAESDIKKILTLLLLICSVMN